MTFEFFRMGYNGLSGKTFGCGCCSTTEPITDEVVALNAFERSIAYYQHQLETVKAQRECVQKYGIARTKMGIDNCTEYLHCKRIVEREHDHGSQGREIFADGLQNAQNNLDRAQRRMGCVDRIIGKIWGMSL